MSLGDFEDALFDLEKCSQIQTNDEECTKRLAIVHASMAEDMIKKASYRSALEKLDKVLALLVQKEMANTNWFSIGNIV